MFISRDDNNRFIASFDAAAMLRKVIDNTENASLVFESVEGETTNSAMLIEGDAESVWNNIREAGVPVISRV